MQLFSNLFFSQWNGVSRPEGYFLIGCNLERQNINKSYVLQDLRLYDVTLTSSQTMELKSMTAQDDIIPVSGYVKYKYVDFCCYQTVQSLAIEK